MKRLALVAFGLAALAWPALAAAHPLGNFTINRFSRIEASGPRLYVRYVLDMAEIPTYQAGRIDQRTYALRIAANAHLAVDGRPVTLVPLRSALAHPRGAAGLRRFEWDCGTVKVDWTLDGPIPWEAGAVGEAGTVHVGRDLDELSRHALALATGRLPDRPFLVLGQYAAIDPSRAPEGKEVAWAYTHVPQRVRGDDGDDGLTGTWDERESAPFSTT